MHHTGKTHNQNLYIRHFTTKKVTIGIGPAGTGKTLLAMDYALSSIVKRIILTRPIVEACGEEIGFLPGKAELKIAPYLRVFDEYMRGVSLKGKEIDKLPLAHMRGLTFNDCIIILDEAQNCSYEQLEMILTRLGHGANLIINGDTEQSDIHNNGLMEVVNRISDMPEVGVVRFTDEDVQRSKFVREVVSRLRRKYQ